MAKLLSIAAVLMVLQTAYTYILLTADLEDVHNVAKQLLSSPITGSVQNILRRAYNVFTDQLEKTKSDRNRDDFEDNYRHHRASDGSLESEHKPTDDDADGEKSHRNGSKDIPDLITLGKYASVYLNKFKKMLFEDAGPQKRQ